MKIRELQKGRRKETQDQIDASLADRTPQEWAFLAGFIDGEGCIAVYENKGRSGYMQVSFSIRAANCDPRIIEWLKDRFGGGTTKRGGARAGSGRWREAYTWYALNRRAATIMRAIRPYTVIKGEQIDLALKFRETYGAARDPVTGRNGSVPTHVRAARAVLLADIKALKHRSFN